MIEKNNDNSVVQPSSDEDGYMSRPREKSERKKEETESETRKSSMWG